MKFGLEVLKAVRAEVGEDFCVGMRICGDEFHPDGLSHEDMKQIAKYYSDTGMLDFIGVVGSGCDTHNTLANVIPNTDLPAGAVPAPGGRHQGSGRRAGATRAEHQGPEPGHARILEGGYVDMVGMTRAHIADPHLIAKIKMGQVDQIEAVRRSQLLHRPPVPGPGRAVHPERRDLPRIHGRAAHHREVRRTEAQGGGGRRRSRPGWKRPAWRPSAATT